MNVPEGVRKYAAEQGIKTQELTRLSAALVGQLCREMRKPKRISS